MEQTDQQTKDGEQLLEVTVIAPRFPNQPREFEFNKHLSVGDAAAKAAEAFGYEPGTFSFAKGGKELDRTMQLVAAGVREDDTLNLVEVGGGV